MRKTSITSAGGLGVQVIMTKTAPSPRRRPPQPVDERDVDTSADQAAPAPGTGKLVDKTA
jgi:hypothetical protein